MWKFAAAAGMVLALVGCVASSGQDYTMGAVVLQEDFSRAYGWDVFSSPAVTIGPRDGVYDMRSNVREYVRGFNSQVDDDVVIEVQARQLSAYPNNAYGVVCRATPNNVADGYYFLIGGDGSYSIRRGRDQDVDALVSWQRSPVIEQGRSGNLIRVVCVGDYLALYVNGQFVAEARDSSFKSGYTGFAVAVAQGNDLWVTFDNLTIWEAALSN